MSFEELGAIVLDNFGPELCMSAYGTTDLYWLGRHARGYGEIDAQGNIIPELLIHQS